MNTAHTNIASVFAQQPMDRETVNQYAEDILQFARSRGQSIARAPHADAITGAHVARALTVVAAYQAQIDAAQLGA